MTEAPAKMNWRIEVTFEDEVIVRAEYEAKEEAERMIDLLVDRAESKKQSAKVKLERL